MSTQLISNLAQLNTDISSATNIDTTTNLGEYKNGFTGTFNFIKFKYLGILTAELTIPTLSSNTWYHIFYFNSSKVKFAYEVQTYRGIRLSSSDRTNIVGTCDITLSLANDTHPDILAAYIDTTWKEQKIIINNVYKLKI